MSIDLLFRPIKTVNVCLIWSGMNSRRKPYQQMARPNRAFELRIEKLRSKQNSSDQPISTNISNSNYLFKRQNQSSSSDFAGTYKRGQNKKFKIPKVMFSVSCVVANQVVGDRISPSMGDFEQGGVRYKCSISDKNEIVENDKNCDDDADDESDSDPKTVEPMRLTPGSGGKISCSEKNIPRALNQKSTCEENLLEVSNLKPRSGWLSDGSDSSVSTGLRARDIWEKFNLGPVVGMNYEFLDDPVIQKDNDDGDDDDDNISQTSASINSRNSGILTKLVQEVNRGTSKTSQKVNNFTKFNVKNGSKNNSTSAMKHFEYNSSFKQSPIISLPFSMNTVPKTADGINCLRLFNGSYRKDNSDINGEASHPTEIGHEKSMVVEDLEEDEGMPVGLCGLCSWRQRSNALKKNAKNMHNKIYQPFSAQAVELVSNQMENTNLNSVSLSNKMLELEQRLAAIENRSNVSPGFKSSVCSFSETATALPIPTAQSALVRVGTNSSCSTLVDVETKSGTNEAKGIQSFFGMVSLDSQGQHQVKCKSDDLEANENEFNGNNSQKCASIEALTVHHEQMSFTNNNNLSDEGAFVENMLDSASFPPATFSCIFPAFQQFNCCNAADCMTVCSRLSYTSFHNYPKVQISRWDIQSRTTSVKDYSLDTGNILSFTPQFPMDMRMKEETLDIIHPVSHVRARFLREKQHGPYYSPIINLNVSQAAPEVLTVKPWKEYVMHLPKNNLHSYSSESLLACLPRDLHESQRNALSLDGLNSIQDYVNPEFMKHESSCGVSCAATNAKTYTISNVGSTIAQWSEEDDCDGTYSLSSSRLSIFSILTEGATVDVEACYKQHGINNNSLAGNECARFNNIDNTSRVSSQDYALPCLPEKEKSLLSKIREARENGSGQLSMPVPSYSWEEFKDTTNEQDSMVLERLPLKKKAAKNCVPSVNELMETMKKVKAAEQKKLAPVPSSEFINETKKMTVNDANYEESKSSALTTTEAMNCTLRGPVVDYKERRRLRQELKLDAERKELIAMTECALKERFSQRKQEVSNDSTQLGNAIFCGSTKAMFDHNAPIGEQPKTVQPPPPSFHPLAEMQKPVVKQEACPASNDQLHPEPAPEPVKAEIKAEPKEIPEVTTIPAVSTKPKKKSKCGKHRSMNNYNHPSNMCCQYNHPNWSCGGGMCCPAFGMSPQMMPMPSMLNFQQPTIFQHPQQTWGMQMGQPVPPQAWLPTPQIRSSGDLKYDSDSYSRSRSSSVCSSRSSSCSSSCSGSRFSSSGSSSCNSVSDDEEGAF